MPPSATDARALNNQPKSGRQGGTRSATVRNQRAVDPTSFCEGRANGGERSVVAPVKREATSMKQHNEAVNLPMQAVEKQLKL